jgi:hypothetical protein
MQLPEPPDVAALMAELKRMDFSSDCDSRNGVLALLRTAERSGKVGLKCGKSRGCQEHRSSSAPDEIQL